MHYIVVGANEATGQELTLTINAENETSAATAARSKGIFPTRIAPLLAQRVKVEDAKAPKQGDLIAGYVLAGVFVAAIVLYFMFRGQYGSAAYGTWESGTSDSPLTGSERRASQVFQDAGASRSNADAAARKLNQMLERDRTRGR